MITRFSQFERTLAGLLFCASLGARAADDGATAKANASTSNWTLSQWIEKARDKSEILKASEAKKRAARANESLVFSQIYPKLSASYVFARSDTGSGEARNGQTLVLSAEQQLFKGLGEWRALRSS